jgi:hypothetical protein
MVGARSRRQCFISGRFLGARRPNDVSKFWLNAECGATEWRRAGNRQTVLDVSMRMCAFQRFVHDTPREPTSSLG